MATPKPAIALGSEAARSAADRSAVFAAALVIGLGMLGTTLAQTQILGRIPIQNLLKNALHVDRAANAAFFFWVGIPWYLKPLFGIICDAFPLFGTRRKHYLLLGAGLATLAWLALAITPLRYEPLLMVSLVINFALVIASTALGGYMVDVAQSSSSA